MRKVVILALIIVISIKLCAQNRVISGDLRYTTELQYNFKNKYNWVNLLDFNVQLSTQAIGVWRNGFLNMELISIYRTAKERILDDKQIFSNIDEMNQPLRIFTLGYTQEIGSLNLFFGIRNVNRDYFTTPYTSLLTSSSCGIYPTISANYPLANYPLSAMCLYTDYEIGNNWSVKNSLYNGVAYESFSQVFTINPKQDGIFNMTQISYSQNSKYHGIYSLGSAIHNRIPVRNDNRKTKLDYSLWANIEQCIYTDNGREIGVLAQCSFAPSSTNLCSQYYGVGLLFNGWTTNSKKDQFGVFINSAKFDIEKEISLELTWKHQIMNNVEFQPALHLIENGGNVKVVGLLRLSYTLNFQ